MKNKALLITTIIFFLVVNTTYYWEIRLGFWAMPVMLFLVIAYIVLLIALLQQFFLLIKEKGRNRQRIMVTAILSTVIVLTFLKPSGLVNFEKFEGRDILIAGREGAANCNTTFTLKDDRSFTERSFCFGATEIKGQYRISNDTIYFEHIVFGRGENEYYTFAVVKPSKYYTDDKHFDLLRYKNLADTVGSALWITKNELQ